ncbi:TetR/AcrR family transcriptional regulator [Streptomyces sp. NPDC051018]|uniref:TetR/AcrR family transcriptional regulator n=1 Tax=Streptomyces sp. NPDC051018 TaxID=3365639 RepID=UPI0037872D6A
MTTKTARPAHRPRDRRAQILAAAVESFHRSGYHATSMEDIAGAVGITAGALYRHFRSKREMLGEALLGGLELLTAAIDEAGDLDAVIRTLTAFSLDHGGYALLWDRESPALSDEQAGTLHQGLSHLEEAVTQAVRASRADLGGADASVVAVSLTAVLLSPSYHHTRLSRPRYEALLYAQASAVCRTRVLPSATGGGPSPAPWTSDLRPASRREALLSAGGRLFRERGFQAVSMEEIGAAAGIAGPSVYKHFVGKADLLAATVRRETEAMFFALSRALARSASSHEALVRLLGSFVEVVGARKGPGGFGVGDENNLPPEEQRWFHKAQIEYVAEWVALLMAARPELKEGEARVTVHSALTLVRLVYQITDRGPFVPAGTVVGLALDVLGIEPVELPD